MANLSYENRRQNRFELQMNRKEVQELVLACQHWQLYAKAGPRDGRLNSVVEQIEQFFKDERQWNEDGKVLR